eukprot:scaffold3759_cov169-Amphora_coffeaeformis.AAC.2
MSNASIWAFSHCYLNNKNTNNQFTVLLVGYFVLGPSDLYKLTKEIGKFIQNIRTLGTDLTTTLESNMESQLQLEELRKAQRELNDAFSFRRSINTDDAGDAFSTTVDTPRPATVQDDISASVVAGDGSTSTTTSEAASKKKIRRRVKRKVAPSTTMAAESSSASLNGNIPESLDMPPAAASGAKSTVDAGKQSVDDKYANRPTDPFIDYTEEEQKLIDEEFDQYVSLGGDNDEKSDSWFSETAVDDKAIDKGSSSKLPMKAAVAATEDPQMQAATSRFQQQLSGGWNEQIMASEDQLEPLAKVMQLLASLEEEKIASTKRLEEEFRKRAEMEEEFYRKQRKVLEESAAQVQKQAAASSPQTFKK